MPADIRVEGADKLGALSAKLKNADKSIQKSMRQRLRQATKPLVLDVKAEAAKHSKSVPGSIVLEMKYTERRAGAYIKAKKSRMDARKHDLPGLLEYGSKGSGGKYIRHPVFAEKGGTSRLTGRRKYRNLSATQGRRVVWVNQPTHPFLTPTVQKHADDVRRELTKIIDDVERDLA